MKKIGIIADSPVSDHDETRKIQTINIFLQCRPEGQMVQGVPGESFNGYGNAGIIHEKPHLNNREFPLFFTDAHLALSLFDDVTFFIQNILVGFTDLKIEVCHIIIDDLRGTASLFHQVGVDAPDDLIFMVCDKTESIINVVRVKVTQDRFVVIPVLADGCTFRSRIEEASENEQFRKAIDIILQFRESFVGGEERIQTQFLQDPFHEDMGKELWMAKTVGAALVDGEPVGLCLVFTVAIRFEFWNKRGPGFKRSFQALYIVGLSIIKP